MDRDIKHLRWLSIAYYAMGVVYFLFAIFSIIFLVFGVLFLTTDILQKAGNPEHAGIIFGSLNLFVSFVFIGGGIILAYLAIRAARSLSKQENAAFCLVVAVINCLFSPFGLILGILTIIVLMRDSVKKLFDVQMR